MDLASDEWEMLEQAAVGNGRHVYRARPVKDMVRTSGIAFVLQRHGLLKVDVIFVKGVPEVIPIELTAAGRSCLEQDRPEFTRWVRENVGPDTASTASVATPDIARYRRRIAEVEQKLTTVGQHQDLLRVEREAIRCEFQVIVEQVAAGSAFVHRSGVLWRLSRSGEASLTPYCPVCRVALLEHEDDNRLGCPRCDFTAPFRPLQIPSFRPRAG